MRRDLYRPLDPTRLPFLAAALALVLWEQVWEELGEPELRDLHLLDRRVFQLLRRGVRVSLLQRPQHLLSLLARGKDNKDETVLVKVSVVSLFQLLQGGLRAGRHGGALLVAAQLLRGLKLLLQLAHVLVTRKRQRGRAKGRMNWRCTSASVAAMASKPGV